MAYRIVRAPQQQQETPQEEGWGEFALRQVAKTPATIARIPGVAGDIQEAVLGTVGLGREEAAKSWPRTIARRIGAPVQFPTSEDIRNVERKILPEYMTETRPGIAENLAEFATQTIPTAAGAGIAQAVKGGAALVPALKAGAQAVTQLSPKSLAGAYTGSHLGAGLGQALGLSEHAQNLLSFAFGFGGATIAPGLKFEAPSKTLERKAFEISKREIPKKIEQLEKVQKTQYSQAEKIGKKIHANAKGLQKTLNQVGDLIQYGVTEADQAKINETLGQLESAIQNKQLNLNNALRFKQNLYGEVYDKNLPANVSRYKKQIAKSLDDFIKQEGAKKPKYGIPLEQAEQATKELAQLREKAYELEDMTFDQYKKKNQQKFGDWAKDYIMGATGCQIIGQGLSFILGPGLSKSVGLAIEGLAMGARETSKIKTILNENPALKIELKLVAKDIAKANWPAAAAGIQKAAQLAEPLEEELKPKSKFRIVRAHSNPI